MGKASGTNSLRPKWLLTPFLLPSSLAIYEGYTVGSQQKPLKKSTVPSKTDAKATGPATPRLRKTPLIQPPALFSSATFPKYQAQRKFEAMRDCYETLYDYSQAGFLRLDIQGKIVESNQTAATMLGINRKILIGQQLLDLIEQEDQETFQLHCRNVLKKETRQHCEVRDDVEHLGLDDQRLWVDGVSHKSSHIQL